MGNQVLVDRRCDQSVRKLWVVQMMRMMIVTATVTVTVIVMDLPSYPSSLCHEMTTFALCQCLEPVTRMTLFFINSALFFGWAVDYGLQLS
jgi:hypothetical protein